MSDSGFGLYQQLYGQPTGNGGTATSASSFPSQYTQAPYPGVSKKELGLVPPSSATEQYLADIQARPAGLMRDSTGAMPSGAMPPAPQDMTIQALLDNLVNASASDPAAIAKLQDALILGGYLDPRKTSYTPGGVVQPGDATWSAYTHLLMDSVRAKKPFQDLLNEQVAAKAGEQKFNLSKVETNTTITNKQTARLTLAQIMKQDLGRMPTNAEIAAYAGQLSADEQANPETTTTTYDLNSFLNAAPGGPTKGATSVTTGGVDPNAEAMNFDMNNNGGEMAKAQSDTVYQLFLSMLSGAGSVS